MSHLSKIFTKVPIDVPNRSGFDMSFENLLTMKCGTLVPVLCEEVIPNETYNIGHVSQIQLPPAATNFFGRIDLRLEAFFVPMRILWGGWQNFWTMPENNPYSSSVSRPERVPYAPETAFNYSDFASGTLSDYLGVKNNVISSGFSKSEIPTLLPFVAYHKIWDDWYRNSKIQNPAFVNNPSIDLDYIYNLPWFPRTGYFDNRDTLNLADGVSLFDLRQRNWAKDYFTTAALYPQASGDVVGATVEGAVSENKADISIPALRAANVLQRWLDRNNIAGERYADQIKAQYGVLPSDAILDRPLFLGSDVVGIYNRSVYQTANNPDSDKNTNPFSTVVGSSGASSAGFKDGGLVDNFKSTEHGYLMILASIVPHAYYSTGMRRQMMHSKVGDFAIPLLQGLGEQPIYDSELASPFLDAEYGIFGYQQQYAEYKYHDDEVHGLLRDGESLESFALQRSFDEIPTLGTQFLQIPTDYLDQVFASSVDVSGFSAWYDIFISMKKISPLSEYVIPTLGDLKNTHKENVPYRGRQL